MTIDDEYGTRSESGPSRRALLKGAAVGAGALWVAPAIATFTAGPAAASPAGCNACGVNMMIGTAANPGTGQNFGDGTLAALAGWTVAGITSVSGLFQANTVTTGTGTFTRDFSSACTARFGTQSPVSVTFAVGILTAGFQGAASSVTLRLYSGLGATGSILSTDTVTNLNSLPSSLTFPIPAGTRSFTIVMSLGASNNGGQQGGIADNIALTLGAC